MKYLMIVFVCTPIFLFSMKESSQLQKYKTAMTSLLDIVDEDFHKALEAGNIKEAKRLQKKLSVAIETITENHNLTNIESSNPFTLKKYLNNLENKIAAETKKQESKYIANLNPRSKL